MENYFLILLCAALCCASISFTITITGMFKWLREALSPIHSKIEDLIHCPWCFGHWVTIIFLLTSNMQRLHFSEEPSYNLLVTWFVIMGMEAPIYYILLRAFEPVLKITAQRKIDNLKRKSVDVRL